MIHEIKAFPKSPRSFDIFWDDVAGTITIPKSPNTAKIMEDGLRKADGGPFLGWPFKARIKDPLHNPAEFVAWLISCDHLAEEIYTLPPSLNWQMGRDLIKPVKIRIPKDALW